MSLKLENDPIKWYTFCSPKAGREYYYEPRSGVVTWILPDDLHPQPVVVKPKDDGVPLHVTGRHVSFHESVENSGETLAPTKSVRKGVGYTATTTNDKWKNGRRIPIIASIILSCLFVAVVLLLLLGTTAFFTGSPAREMLGLEEMFANYTADNFKVWTGGFVGNSKEKDLQSVKPRETNNVQHGGNTERHGDEILSTTADETALLHEKPNEQDTANTAAATTTTTTGADAGSSNYFQEKRQVEKNTATTPSKRQQGSQEINIVPTKRCRLPFAHVFSRKCRKVLAKQPVYDMDAFLDSMI